MIRDLAVVLLVVGIGACVVWMASHTPGGRLAQAGVVGVGLLAAVGIGQAVAKGR